MLGLIMYDSDWGTSDNNRRARFYELSGAERKQIRRETASWESMEALMGRFLRPID